MCFPADWKEHLAADVSIHDIPFREHSPDDASFGRNVARRDEYFQPSRLLTSIGSLQEIEPSPSLSKEAAFLLKECVADSSGQALHLSHLNGYVLQVKEKNLIEDGNSIIRSPGIGTRRWQITSALLWLRISRCFSASLRIPGNVEQTRIPTALFGNTCQRELICLNTLKLSSTLSRGD